MKPMKKILVPTDFSECAEAALEYALGLARLTGASVTLFHVYQLPQIPAEAAFEISDKMMAAMNQAADTALQRAKADAERDETIVPGILTKLVSGIPYVEIAKEAGDGYDLIVIATHGRTGLAHMLIGSVAERVVRMAPCPVLTVRSPA